MAWNLSPTARGSIDAPEMGRRADEISASTGTLTSAANAVGTPPIAVALVRSTIRQKFLTISGLRIPEGDMMITLAPARKQDRLHEIAPPTWNNGKPTVSPSVSRMSYRTATPNAATIWLRWVCTKSFGEAVVPPVWKKAAISASRPVWPD